MPGSDITGWVYRGLTLLIACCPTALALAVPLAFVCGGGRLESEGVHMKGSEAMERTGDLLSGRIQQDRHSDHRQSAG